MVLGPQRKGIKLTYTQTHAPRNQSFAMRQIPTCLSARGMYGEEDKADKAKGYKHMTFKEAAVLARRCPCGRAMADPLQPLPDPAGRFYGKCAEDFSKCLPGKRRKEHGVKLSGRVMCNGDVI